MPAEIIALSHEAFLSEVADVPAEGVRIWSAHLDGLPGFALDELRALLDVAELGRAARFHFERDRDRYIATRGLLRFLLGRASDQPGSKVNFEYSAHGKPALARNEPCAPALRFNVSHSGGWAIFALSWNREVGVDLEGAARLDHNEDELSKLAARIMSQQELTVWRNLPDNAARRSAFVRAWTRKEAYSKAIGTGILNNFATVEVALDAASPRASLSFDGSGENGGGRRWSIHDLPAPDGYAAALAVEELEPTAMKHHA